jgi:hypothetical protein
MDYFLELTKMERIETLRLALETLAMARRRPKERGDIISEVGQIAEAYAIYLAQKKKTEQPQVQKGLLQQSQRSEDLTRSLRAER